MRNRDAATIRQVLTRLLFAASWACLAGCGANGKNHAAPGGALPSVPDFSVEIQQILDKKTELIKQLAADPMILEAVKEANQTHAALTKAEILRLDETWQRQDLNELITSCLTNPCAEYLVDFQEAHSGFPEIFVTDRQGLIVAETNKTSDYYQADEAWWTHTYREGDGQSHHGPIEYDESARAEAISIYVPVVDQDSQKAIGVLKAVCDITAIKMEL